MEDRVKPFKVYNYTRLERKGLAVREFQELIEKCKEKFDISAETSIRIVLNEDGTEVDQDYFLTLTDNTALVVYSQERAGLHPQVRRARKHVDRKTNVRDLKRKKHAQKPSDDNMQQEKEIMVMVGWLNFSYKDCKYRLVKATKSHPDSGPRNIRLKLGMEKEDLLTRLKQIFFPHQYNFMGKVTRYDCCLGTFDGKTIDLQGTITEIAKLEYSSSESDLELPEIRVPKKKPRTETVSAVSDSLQADFLNIPDSAVVEVLENDMTPSFKSSMGQSEQGATFIDADTPTVSFRTNSLVNNTIDNICTICCENEKVDFLMPCGHKYCMVCATQQQEQGMRCAKCRACIVKIGTLFD